MLNDQSESVYGILAYPLRLLLTDTYLSPVFCLSLRPE